MPHLHRPTDPTSAICPREAVIPSLLVFQDRLRASSFHPTPFPSPLLPPAPASSPSIQTAFQKNWGSGDKTSPPPPSSTPTQFHQLGLKGWWTGSSKPLVLTSAILSRTCQAYGFRVQNDLGAPFPAGYVWSFPRAECPLRCGHGKLPALCLLIIFERC